MRAVLAILLAVAVGFPPAAAQANRRRRRVSPWSRAQLWRDAARPRLLDPTAARPARVDLSPSFVEFHTARVKNDLMIFHPDFPNLDPSLPRERDRAAEPDAASFGFVQTPRTDDLLELTRRRDRLLLFRSERRTGESTALGLGLFCATTVLAAHAPRPLRVLFDRPIHFGTGHLRRRRHGRGHRRRRTLSL